MRPPADIYAILPPFVEGLQRIVGDKLFAAYVFGAAAFPDAIPSRDIDFHVLLQTELTDVERINLETLHRALTERFPPLGGEMDGYYILLADARRETPPQSRLWRRAIDQAWALHCEHIRAGRHIVLHGPDPREIYPPARWPQLEAALRHEITFVQQHLHDYPDYCILNLCRLIYSFTTQDVVISKAAAADWAHDKLPEWRRHITAAKHSYLRQTTPAAQEFMRSEVGKFFAYAQARIGQVRRENLL